MFVYSNKATNGGPQWYFNTTMQILNIPLYKRDTVSTLFDPGLAEINAHVGPQEVVGHTLNSQLLIG